MRKQLTIGVVLCLVASSVAVGQVQGQAKVGKRRVGFGQQANGAAARKPVQLKSKKAGKAEFASGLDYCDLADVKMKDGKKYSQLQIPGLQVVPEAGLPETPSREELIRVPAGAKVSLVVDSVSWQEVDGEVELSPVQPHRPDVANTDGTRDDKVPFTKNAAAYSVDAFFVDAPIVLGETVRVRGREYVKVTYQPVSYNPVKKKLRVAHDVQWHLDVVPPAKAKRRRPDKFWKQTTDTIDIRTQDQVDAEEPEAAPAPPAEGASEPSAPAAESAASAADADYLIITADKYADEVAPLAAWKHKKGYKSYVAKLSEVGGTDADIASYIQNAYNSGIAPTYVLLVGDHEDLPACELIGHGAYGTGYVWYTDHPYSLVDGADEYPDLYIARLPGDTEAQITTMVNKTLTYEKTPDPGSWYDDILIAGQFEKSSTNDLVSGRCFMEDLHQIADFLGPDYDFYGPWNGFSGDAFNKGFTIQTALKWDTSPTNALQYRDYGYPGKRTPPTYVPQVWRAMGQGATVSTEATVEVSTAINNGVTMVFHRDHGYAGGSGWAAPQFNDSHVSALANGNKLPVVFSLNCDTGWFDGRDKFAEAWMRNANGGAVALVAAVRTSWSGYNDLYHMGIMDTMWDDYTTYDNTQSIPYGNSWRPAEAAVRAKGFIFAGYGTGNTSLSTVRMFSFFGDPELQMRTETPVQLAASHLSEATAGKAVNVTVTVTRGGSACQGALVALVQDSDSIYATATTDASGQATINVTPMVLGALSVTVSERNSIPYEGEITVVAGSDPTIAATPTWLSPSTTWGANAPNDTFTVQNAGGGTISYTISDDAAWLSCTPNSGSSSGESDAITVSYNAAGLAMGVHSATITITDPGAINSPLSVPVQLTVGLPPPVTFYEKTMDSDPGWTLDSGWAFGQPTGGGGSTGNSDPTSGYTGNNVIGYNLSGDYENSINPTRWATTEAIDCSNYAGMTLQFQRWLGVEYDPWDKAYVQASVDGANWTTLWENPDSNLNGGSWELCEYDLPAFMDEQATVYIRWGMGNTDSTVVFCGWNIDDVKLIGSFVGDPGNNTAPVVDAGPNQSVVLVEGAGGGDPVAGAYFEWDAAADTGGDANWESTTANAYTWVFDSGNLSPTVISDARFDRLAYAYSFPGAKDAQNIDFTGKGDTEPATFEFVVDIDGTDGVIFETGGSGDGLQIDIVGGVLRGTVEEDPTEARATYPLTATDLGRFIHVVFVADNANDVVQLYVDGALKDSQPWTTGDDWTGTDDAGLGARYNSIPDGGSTADFTGKIALGRFYRNKALTSAEVATNFDSLSTGDAATADLDGTVSDADGDQLTIEWTKVSGPGAVGFADAAAVDTTATFTELGVYSLRLSAFDGFVQTVDDVTITVTDGTVPPNNAPLANNDSVTTDEDVSVAITLTATDADGDPLTYSIVSQPANGTLSGTAPNVTYTPNSGYSGADSFTFKANDGADDSNIATVSITVNAVIPPNNAPVASNESVTTDQDVAVAITLTATDADGDPLTYSIVSQPANGTLSGTAPNVTYTPNAGYDGADSFTFKANDGTDDSNIATVSITVNPAAQFPVADFALSELTTYGTVNGGIANTYIDTDDVYETLTEAESGGKPANRHSRLEHEWTFDVTGAELVTFYVEAHHDANTEGDDFVFAYSTDGVSYTDMVTVTRTADDDALQYAVLPGDLSGTVYVKVTDTDRTRANRSLERLYIDQMFIVSDVATTPPQAASSPNPANGATDVSLSPILTWTGGALAGSHNVYFGTNPTLGAGDLQGNQSGTSFSPGTLAVNTTYYWAIDEVNGAGTTPGATWSFTTGVGTPEVHVEAITLGTQKAGKNYKAVATVRVVDSATGLPVSGATVTGDFTGAFGETGSAVTDSAGEAVITTGAKLRLPFSVTFSVTDVTLSGYDYNPSNNVMTSQTASF